MKKRFKDKRITIMGLGLHGGGVGVARFFYEMGAKVLITDLKSKEELKESIAKLRGLPIKYILGYHRAKDFIETDLIIKNPAVPKTSFFLKIAEENKIPVKSDINIFCDVVKNPIIGITGTKGKSTVATLLYEILKKQSEDVVLAGNIGTSPLDIVSKIGNKTKIVLELSSFELEDMDKSPQIAIVTALYPDHLDRYKDFQEYLEAKKAIFKFQKKSDILVLDYDNVQTRKFSTQACSQLYFYSRKKIKEKSLGCFLDKKWVFFNEEKDPVFNIKKSPLLGKHNVSNILAATTVAKILKVPNDYILDAVTEFTGVASRQEEIEEKNGVKYFNDTTATMPDAVLAALDTMGKKFSHSQIVLIAGGQDKRLEYKELCKKIETKIKHLVLLPGTASEKIKACLDSSKVKMKYVRSMRGAVKAASGLARPGDIVLLSPAAASFNLFKNEFDRGEKFIECVKALKSNE